MITPVELIGFFSQITNWLISIKNSVRVNREEYENILTLIRQQPMKLNIILLNKKMVNLEMRKKK